MFDTITPYVVCGRCTKYARSQVAHDTVARVRECYQAEVGFYEADEEAQARYEADQDNAYERYLETRDWAEQAAFADWEARMGKVDYFEARDAAMGY